MKRILLHLVLGIMLAPLGSISQDFTFSQFYEKPLLRNPALAGIFNGDIRISAVHRSQWGSVTVPFKTTAASIENKFPVGSANDFFTLGLQMSADIAGDIRLKRTQVFPAVNFHKSLSGYKDEYLSVAFMGGLAGNQFDPTKMKLADQWRNGEYNPANATMQRIDRTGFTYWDLATGITYSSSFGDEGRYYVGAALYHVNKPKVAFNGNDKVQLDERWMVNGGMSVRVSENTKVVAFADYIMQGGHWQALGGLMYGMELNKAYNDDHHTTLYFGSFLRWGDAVMPMTKLEMKNVSVALSYDVNISKLHVASHWRGGFELTGAYTGFLNTRNSTLDKLRCVRF